MSRIRARRRTLDWTGFIQGGIVTQGTQLDFTLHGTIVEAEKSTLTRIRGEIQLCMLQADVGVIGESDVDLFMGIQVVNRVKNLPGVPRSPLLVDDMEGGEWLWLRRAKACWFTTSGTGVPANATVVTGGDIMTGAYDPTVDVKAQRVLNLAQDDLILSFAVGGAVGDNVSADVNLRMLWKRD